MGAAAPHETPTIGSLLAAGTGSHADRPALADGREAPHA